MSKPRAAALGNGVVSTTGALTGRHILEEPFSRQHALKHPRSACVPARTDQRIIESPAPSPQVPAPNH